MDKRFSYYPYLMQLATFGSGINTSTALAQWAYETAYGTSNLWKNNKNPAGIKCHGAMNCENGFRSYSNALFGFYAYVDFLRDNKRYKKAFEKKTTEEQLKEIELAGWNGDYTGSYTANCISIVNSNDLKKFDTFPKIYLVLGFGLVLILFARYEKINFITRS